MLDLDWDWSRTVRHTGRKESEYSLAIHSTTDKHNSAMFWCTHPGADRNLGISVAVMKNT